jgi:hypothetical protein
MTKQVAAEMRRKNPKTLSGIETPLYLDFSIGLVAVPCRPEKP